jgi:hypothetical protein
MKTRHLLVATALIVATVSSGFAQMSPAKADWAKGPVQFLMTPEETATWKTLASDDAALAFIDLFWARRDPTPNTPANEFRLDFEDRVAYADQHFAVGKTKGSLSDRGRALILFGSPSHVTKSGGASVSASRGMTKSDITSGAVRDESDSAERQTWVYEGPVAQKAFGLPQAQLVFVDRLNNGDSRMQTPTFDLRAATKRIVDLSIAQPTLTKAPSFQKAPTAVPAAVPATPAVAAPMTTLKTAALESAVTEAKGGKITKHVAMTSAELVSPTGESYVPVSLYVPASAGLTSDAADTLFGVVEDAAGARVSAFEEPAKLTASKTDWYADKTLQLPAGKYKVTLGLAKAGVPVAVTTGSLDVAGFNKDSVNTSRLILSDNIYELPVAEPVKAPFAFGKLKIVPKATGLFSNKADLGYFVEVNNPGIDPGTNLPKLQYKLDLIGPDKKTISAPLTDAQALPLLGTPGPGHYAILSTIPLGELNPPLKPGDYVLKMKIVDTVSKQSYTVEQAFKVTG